MFLKSKPPVTDTYFDVGREYTNPIDKNACLVWIPDISKFNMSLHYKEVKLQLLDMTCLHDMYTDDKRQLKLSDIASLPVGHVPGILSSCFRRILDSGGNIYAIVTGEPCPCFPPLPAPHEKGGGVVIPCRYVVVVHDAGSIFATLTEVLSDMVEGSSMRLSIL
ncbi:hypothetical protein DPMN_106125 [Dreissena polymorpha]|uniref:Uncharacterized protein n=1 Tax=Dreissena polymorpha TaxID=45954 RepID=A0A9D4QIF1_DREPO|nr:hypothetical protein DPMN_106125 [Dreissena polymorpha]